jgi:hypothetical protein
VWSVTRNIIMKSGINLVVTAFLRSTYTDQNQIISKTEILNHSIDKPQNRTKDSL